MTPPAPNIALYCSSLARAGVERVVCDLALGFRERGQAVTVIAFLDGELAGELRDAGISVKILDRGDPASYRPSALRSLLASLRMARTLRARRVQHLCVHGLGAHRVALFAARLARTRLRTFVFHSNYPELRAADPQRTQQIRRELEPFDHHIAITPGIAELVVESGVVDPADLSVIPNGVRIGRATRPRAEVRAELGLAEDDRVAMLVARMNPLKNHRTAVRAMGQVVRTDPDVHLLLVGEGPEEAAVRELIGELGLEANVHRLGLRNDVPDLLGAADLFLLPSDYEGLPVSLLEAMGSGLPVVATDVVGIADTLAPDPDCARLVAPRDEAALAAAIRAAFTVPGWLARAGESAARLARDHYDARVMVDRYAALHARLEQSLTDSPR